jgi:hypothetical protein
MNRSAKDGQWSSPHYGGEGVRVPAHRTKVCADDNREVGADISASEIPADAVPGVGSGNSTQKRGQNKRPRIAAKCSGAGVLKRCIGGGRPRTLLRARDTWRQ